jgi:hypothetical protein
LKKISKKKLPYIKNGPEKNFQKKIALYKKGFEKNFKKKLE